MRYFLAIFLVCCVTLAVVRRSPHTTVGDGVRYRHAQMWIEWLGPLSIGDSAEAAIKKLTAECVLCGAHPLGGSGAVEHVFVLDDVTELTIDVDDQARIRSLPTVKDKGKWLRFPDGTLMSVVDRSE